MSCYAVIDTDTLYEVVLEKRDDNARLVTGNLKHFPAKPFVVTARQMLEILNQQ